MKEFFSTVWGWFAAAVAAGGTIWTATKIVGATRRWFAVAKEKRKQRDSFPDKMLTSMQNISSRLDAIDNSMNNIKEQINGINQRLDENDDATSTLMLQKMMEAYHRYVLQKEQIPLDIRTSLCVMFDQYKSSGRHNHVPENFKEAIMACKVK